MNKDLANHVIFVSFKSASALNDLIPILKEHCEKDEYEKLVKVIASISADINLNILELVYKEYPEIRKEVDEKINKYGVLI